MANTPKPEIVSPAEPAGEPIAAPTPAPPSDEITGITKPESFSLEGFKSKRVPTIANVQTLQTALPHYKISDARDFVRVHPDEENYWSPEYCFTSVPVKGQKKDLLHLIYEDVAMQYLPSARIQRFRLALATKPYDVFFLCHVPSQNLENKFNETSLLGCEEAKRHWVEVTSRKGEGVDEYKINLARNQDAFPAPNWPCQPLDELILITFNGRTITSGDHPGLLRLIGAKQSLK